MKVTTRVLQTAPIAEAGLHRFGLSESNWQRLRGKLFWVTGAATGFGRCIALGLMAAGARVVLSSRRDALLQSVLDEALRLGFQTAGCRVLALDLNQSSAIDRACREFENTQELDGIVYSAAVPGHGPCTGGAWEEWDATMTPNVRSAWYLVRQAFSHMQSPRILMLGSEAGWDAGHGVGLYSVSKSALNGLVQAMADEYVSTYPSCDVQVNLLNPGEARTEMNRGSANDPMSVVSMALHILAQPEGGPNGCFFHSDGRHLAFGHSPPHPCPLN